MIRRTLALALFGLLALNTRPAQAQMYRPPAGLGTLNRSSTSALQSGYQLQYQNLSQGPRLSPYLNLLRGGNSAANYYLGVVTERDRRGNDALYQSSILQLDREVAGNNALSGGVDEELPQLAGTGHAAAFLSYGPYFRMSSQTQFMPAQQGAGAGNQQRRR